MTALDRFTQQQQEKLEIATPLLVTDRLLAERLASSDLPNRLRYILAGPDAGPRAWSTGNKWERVLEPVPLVLSTAVHREIGALIAAGSLDLKAAREYESTSKLKAILAQAQGYPSMQLSPADLDPVGLLATPVDVLDLTTGERLAPSPSRAITRTTGVPYDPEARSAFFDLVLKHLDSLGPDAHGILRRYVGAAVVGRAPDRKLLWLWGSGGDGKSTMARILKGALGDYADAIPAEALADQGARGAHGHELLSPLAGARLGSAMEVPANVNWPLLKALSGGDLRTTKRLHGRAFAFEPRCHLLIASNEEPRVPHGDQAARDRLVVVRWTKPAEPEPELAAVLSIDCPERDALFRAALAWAVRGAAEYLHDGYGVAEAPAVGYEAPEGLAAWWAHGVASGAILAGSDWTPAAVVIDGARGWLRANGVSVPSDTAIGIFMKTRSACMRRGPRKVMSYRVTLKTWVHSDPDTVGTGSKPSLSTRIEETVLTLSHACPAPTEQELLAVGDLLGLLFSIDLIDGPGAQRGQQAVAKTALGGLAAIIRSIALRLGKPQMAAMADRLEMLAAWCQADLPASNRPGPT